MGTSFAVLGQVRLCRDGRLVPAGGRMRSILLGVLLARANTAVPVDVLVNAMWGEPAPRTAQRLHLHVHRLRRTLDDPDRLTFHPDGYRLRVAADELDAARFERLLDDQRPETLRVALALWQGDPYAGLDVPILTKEAARLTELRLTAVETWFAAELAAGRATEVVDELSELVRATPLRERAHQLHITALREAGRPAEARTAYERARDVLATDLGTNPGFELLESTTQPPSNTPERAAQERTIQDTSLPP
jgi:DNA-binding SARP family transcriptional activator